MICKNCHSEISDGSITCSVCGKQLVVSSDEAGDILEWTVKNATPASAEVVGELLSTTAEAALELQDYLSIKQQLKNFAAIQAMPALKALNTINNLPTDAKLPGESLLVSTSVMYGATSSYMQNAKLELTPRRLLFYEHINTSSGLLNIATALMTPRFSFSLALKQIVEVKNYEVNYNPGHLLKLVNDEQLLLQAADFPRFDKALRAAIDTIKTNPNRVM
ncbi:MAG: zinc-ribbon domain-containing protein [Candidatus Bruticola sp.]